MSEPVVYQFIFELTALVAIEAEDEDEAHHALEELVTSGRAEDFARSCSGEWTQTLTGTRHRHPTHRLVDGKLVAVAPREDLPPPVAGSPVLGRIAQEILEQVRRELSGLHDTVSEPAFRDGVWYLDLSRAGKAVSIQIEAADKIGFTVLPSDYGFAADEYFASVALVVQRIVKALGDA